MDGDKGIEWEDIYQVWVNGNTTLQVKATEYGIEVADILLYAKQNGWGPRGSGFVETSPDQSPEELVRELTISNLSAMSLLLNGNMSPKGHFEIQRTIQMAKETLGLVPGEGGEEQEMTKERLIQLAKDRGLPTNIFT